MKRSSFIILIFSFFLCPQVYSQNVGIGTSTPTAKLEVNGNIKIDGGNPQAGRVLTTVNGTGLATWEDIPSTPKVAFRATLPSSQVIPNFVDTKLNFIANYFNDGAAFNDATNSFITPANGLYYFHASFTVSTPTTVLPVVIRIEKGGFVMVQKTNAVFQSTSGYLTAIDVSGMAKLNTGDLITVNALITSASTITLSNYNGSTFFEGYRIY